MSQRSRTRIVEFKAQTQSKIATLLNDYAEGKISREQFDAIYEHYSGQLDLADTALESSDSGMVEGVEGRTVGIRHSRMGKAVGVLIYHRRSKAFFEALGSFDVPRERFIERFRSTVSTAPGRTGVFYRREELEAGRWLLYTADKQTLVVTLFQNEPSPAQIAEMQRLHQDFEMANKNLLNAEQVETDKLAMPFRVFVQRKRQGAS